jgi:hypothetical protein
VCKLPWSQQWVTGELLESFANGAEERIALDERRITLTGKLKTLKDLDDQIIDILSGHAE